MSTQRPIHKAASERIAELSAIERLMIQFMSNSTSQEVNKMDWSGMSHQLRIPLESTINLISKLGEERLNQLWELAIALRVENTLALQPLVESTAERAMSKAMNKLEALLDKNLVTDVGELLQISKVLGERGNRRSPPPAGGSTVNLFVGAQNNSVPITMQNGQTLPSGDDIIFLDLAPAVTQSIQKPRDQSAGRVIDSEMITAEDVAAMQLPTKG